MIYNIYRETIVTIIEMHNYCTSYLSNSFASVGLCAHVLDLVQLFIMFMQYLMGAKYISVIWFQTIVYTIEKYGFTGYKNSEYRCVCVYNINRRCV